MADNTQLNEKVTDGDVIATDDIGGVKFQRVKLIHGADGTNDGDVSSANPLPVTGAVTLSEPISVDDNGGSLTVDVGTALPAGTNNIGDVDIASIAAGDNNIGNVDIVTVPAPLSTTGGGTEATALRVTLATDSTGVVSVDDNGSSLTVDNAALSVVGGGTEATAQRVTLASDSTGVLSVDDNGGSLTVDVGTALPAGTNNIGDVDIASDATHVTEDAVSAGNPAGPQMMVRTRTAPTVEVSNSGDHAALSGPVEGGIWTKLIGDGIPAEAIGGTTANGLDVDVTRVPAPLSTTGNGTAATALRVTLASDTTGLLAVSPSVDPWPVGQSDPTALNAQVQGMAAADAAVSGNPLYSGARASAATPTAVSANGDAVGQWADLNGRPIVLIGAPNALTTRGLTNYTTTTAADVIAAAGAGVKIAVMGILVVNGHATVSTKVSIRDDATVKVTGFAKADGGGFSVPAGSCPIFTTTANAPVRAVCGTTGADVDVTVWGYLTP